MSREPTEQEKAERKAALAVERAKNDVRGITTKFMRDNFIRRPTTCECLAPRPQIHHIDYARPLIVGFLCARCHTAEHRGALRRPYRIYDLTELVNPDPHVQVQQ